MGCGASTVKGAAITDPKLTGESFFPPPETTPTKSLATTTKSVYSATIPLPQNHTHSPNAAHSPKNKQKIPYVPPTPISEFVKEQPIPSHIIPDPIQSSDTSAAPDMLRETIPQPLQEEGSMGHDDDDDDDGNASLDAEDFMGGTPEELHETLHDEALNITEDLKEFAPPEAKDDTEEHSEQDLTEISYKSIDVTPEPSSASGMRFDEIYRLKGVLGTGAFSTVREGFHRNNRYRSFAVKCINRKKLSEEDEAALLDEVSILKEMRHVHIIRLYDFFEEPSTYYLVMERMRGGELFDRIVAKAYYNEKEARDTCKILLEAVGYCHQNHVAHRDLKPENLLLLSGDDDSAVKIADFGFAKKVYERNSLTTQCGTPGYVAPEILEGTPYDERADMWSVGVILYILLGGYPPFIESTQRDLFRKIRKGEYEFHEEYWGTVSAEAKDLIASLLTVDANKRLTADEGLENSWIQGDAAKLAKKDLGANLEKFRNFNGKRKLRAAVSAVIAMNKLNSLGKDLMKNVESSPA